MKWREQFRVVFVGSAICAKLLFVAFVAARFDLRIMMAERIAEWWANRA